MTARLTAVALVLGVLSVAGPATSASKSPERQWIDTTLAKMGLEEKVGQMLVISAAGHSVSDDDPAAVAANQAAYGLNNFADLIDKYHLGGIVYFGNNLSDPSQIVTLSNGIQVTELSSPDAKARVPALISTDQEGGTVQLIRSPAVVFPGNMALGATRDSGLAGDSASVMGREMRAMGVNTDLAPVVDVNTEPLNQADGSRSYSDRTGVVTDFAEHQVRGFQQDPAKGVAATVKHFPGLGSATINTDLGPAFSDRTLAELRRIDLPPFRKAVKAGAMSVMTNFLTYRNIDPAVPAAFSDMIVNGLLKKEMNFKGVVITDSLQAAAVKALNKTPAEIAVMAIDAGTDQLLEQAPGTGKADLDGAYNGILAAVRGGQISEGRIDDSVRRILHVKWTLGLVKDAIQDPEDIPRIVGTEAHVELGERATNDSITMLKNSDKLLPLQTDKTRKSVMVTGYQTSTLPCVDTVASALADKRVPVTAYQSGYDPDPAHIAEAVRLAGLNDLVVVITYNVWRDTQRHSQELIHALVRTGKPVVVISMGAPYDIAYVPEVAAYLAVYNYYSTSLDAAVDTLLGDVNPSGKLSVTITQPPPSTSVLYPFGAGLSYPS